MKAIIILLLLFIVSCKDDVTVQKASKGFCFTIVHTHEGKNVWAISYRTIYVKETTGSKIVWDTAWHYPRSKPLRDTTGKVLTDSTGNPVMGDEIVHVPIGKDSVMWRVEGIHIDSLLKSFKPRK